MEEKKNAEVKVLTRKEERYEKRKAKYEAKKAELNALDFDEYEIRRRARIKNRFRIFAGIAGASAAAFAAGKAAAANEYRKELGSVEVPARSLEATEFKPADTTPTPDFNPGRQWTATTTVEPTGNE